MRATWLTPQIGQAFRRFASRMVGWVATCSMSTLQVPPNPSWFLSKHAAASFFGHNLPIEDCSLSLFPRKPSVLLQRAAPSGGQRLRRANGCFKGNGCAVEAKGWRRRAKLDDIADDVAWAMEVISDACDPATNVGNPFRANNRSSAWLSPSRLRLSFSRSPSECNFPGRWSQQHSSLAPSG